MLDESRCEVGITNYILVDRLHLLETAFDEISDLENLFLTLEVQFYGEVCSPLVWIILKILLIYVDVIRMICH